MCKKLFFVKVKKEGEGVVLCSISDENPFKFNVSIKDDFDFFDLSLGLGVKGNFAPLNYTEFNLFFGDKLKRCLGSWVDIKDFDYNYVYSLE
jgi:hypothetical protein